eukprot:TRINITY_DN34055_c0_g2_i1.p2 TRINITY_DN34055_c0_g2~~TRINITY_DN34055_c0_g2_i1.p2  ORF type:complete len:325 (-),score=13.86 TRINITY_DN34055_c0_g2_i1:193-1167(-)
MSLFGQNFLSRTQQFMVVSDNGRQMRVNRIKAVNSPTQTSTPNIPTIKQLVSNYETISDTATTTSYLLHIRTDKCKSETALQICLLNNEGAAILHRVDVINDNGVRFQSTSTDTDCFTAPILNNLSGLIVGPESGELYLEDIEVHYNGTVNKFVCRGFVGDRDCSACWLQVVKPGNVVLASGKQVTQEEADVIKTKNMQDYQKLKSNSYKILSVLLIFGSLAVYQFADLDDAKAFLFGGLVGGILQFQTQLKVDNQFSQENSMNYQLLGWIAVGVTVVSYLNINSFTLLSSYPYVQTNILQYMLFALLGYSMNKLSLVTSALSL